MMEDGRGYLLFHMHPRAGWTHKTLDFCWCFFNEVILRSCMPVAARTLHVELALKRCTPITRSPLEQPTGQGLRTNTKPAAAAVRIVLVSRVWTWKGSTPNRVQTTEFNAVKNRHRSLHCLFQPTEHHRGCSQTNQIKGQRLCEGRGATCPLLCSYHQRV